VGEAWTSYFHIAQRVLTIPTMFMLGVSRTSLTALGELAGKKDWRGFRRLFTRVTLLTGGVLSAAILVGLPLVKPIASHLFPADYAEPVFAYYRILALGYMPFTFAVAIEAFYISTNHVRTWLLITVIGAVITIPTNVWLILNVPYLGTAWGLSLYQSWVMVHLAWIFWALYSGRVTRWGQPPDEGGGESGAGAKGRILGPGDAAVLAEADLDIAGRASGTRE
jgi:O-antigen/teichoic acid export membrane protein